MVQELCGLTGPSMVAGGRTAVTRRRHTPEQIIRKLAEGQKLLAGGATVEQVCRDFQIAESTWARWLNQSLNNLTPTQFATSRTTQPQPA